MTTPTKHHVFTKQFWNRSRVIWGLIVGLCTSIPLVGGSLVLATKWADANIVSPYIVCKIDSVCQSKQQPILHDMKTMISDIKFMRGCTELSTPKFVQDKVVYDMKLDSIEHSKYITR